VEPLEDRRLLAFSPTGLEQEMLEHVNRMRMDPQGELDVLFTSLDPLISPDPDVTNAINYFGDPTPAEIAQDWPLLVPAAPLAWNESLYNSATDHSELIIQFDEQSHQLPGEPSLSQRITDAGYTNWSIVAENVFAYAESVFHGHSAFAVDWGVSDRGHRENLMRSEVREVGISIIPESNPDTQVGPLVVTQDFGNRWNQGNPYLLGVVYADGNGNGRYDAGEGRGNVNVDISGSSGTFQTTTMTAGGYQLQVPAGIYTVTASGGSLSQPLLLSDVAVASANVKVDFDAANAPAVAVNDAYAPTLDTPLDISASQGVLANDNPVDGDSLTAILVDGPTHGSLTFRQDGSFTYTPSGGYLGADSFTYRARDGQVDSNVATVQLRVLPPVTLDVDDNGEANALTDGVIILRYLFGFEGQALVEGSLAPDANRTDPAEIVGFLQDGRDTMLDVDANGRADALSDGVVILRYLFGFTGPAMVDGVLAPDATRTDPVQIAAFLDQFNPGVLAAATAGGTGSSGAFSPLAAAVEDSAAGLQPLDGSNLQSAYQPAALSSAVVFAAEMPSTVLVSEQTAAAFAESAPTAQRPPIVAELPDLFDPRFAVPVEVGREVARIRNEAITLRGLGGPTLDRLSATVRRADAALREISDFRWDFQPPAPGDG